MTLDRDEEYETLLMAHEDRISEFMKCTNLRGELEQARHVIAVMELNEKKCLDKIASLQDVLSAKTAALNGALEAVVKISAERDALRAQRNIAGETLNEIISGGPRELAAEETLRALCAALKKGAWEAEELDDGRWAVQMSFVTLDDLHRAMRLTMAATE